MDQIKRKENRDMGRTILSLAWPTMLEQLSQSTVQYIDTAMVGALGTQATAAVGSTTTVNWLIFSTIASFSVGFLSFIARAYGANDRSSAKRAVSQAVLVVLFVGIIFTFLTLALSGKIPVWMQVDQIIQKLASIYFFILYLPMLPRTASVIFGTVLRATGDTKTPMKISLITNAFNIILNFLLIYQPRTISVFTFNLTIPGAGLGVVGAALASAVAFTVGGIWITAALWHHPAVSPRGQSLTIDMGILRTCMKISLPNMLQRFGTSLGYVLFASMINSLGEISTAAHTIANTVESAFYIPGYGMQTAAATLAGNAYGARDNEHMINLVKIMIPIEIALMIGSGTILFTTAPWLMRLFSSDVVVISLGVTVLRMVAVSEPFYGFSIIIEGLLMGVGKTKLPFIFNIIGMWCVRIVGTFICTQVLNMQLVSAWACMIAHNLLLFVLFFIVYTKGIWNPLNKENTTQRTD